MDWVLLHNGLAQPPPSRDIAGCKNYPNRVIANVESAQDFKTYPSGLDAAETWDGLELHIITSNEAHYWWASGVMCDPCLDMEIKTNTW